MKVTLILLTLLWFYKNTASADEGNAKFWEIVSEYDSILFNTDISRQSLERLESLAISSGGVLERKEIIFKTIQYLEIHSSINILKEYLMNNLIEIGHSHVDYLMIAAKLRIISSIYLSNDNNKFEYIRCEMKSCKLYSLALRLFIEKDLADFKNLERHCNQNCNFPLYHLSMMEYFKKVEDFSKLEHYTKGIIAKTIDGKLMTSEPLLPRYAMAYLSYVLNENGKKEASEFFLATAHENMSSESFSYKLIHLASSDL